MTKPRLQINCCRFPIRLLYDHGPENRRRRGFLPLGVEGTVENVMNGCANRESDRDCGVSTRKPCYSVWGSSPCFYVFQFDTSICVIQSGD